MIAKPLLALALLARVGFALAFELRVEPEENNVTADRLAGTWESDPELCKRLGVRSSETQIEFVVDDSFLSSVPEKFNEFLADKQIFEAGRMTWREDGTPKTYPYMLIEHAGNPHLLMLRARDGEPLGDAESCNLIVVPAKEHSKDVLFLGGDFDNQPFRPFKRVVADEQ